MSKRDEQFAGFAKLLFKEIYATLAAFDGHDGDIPDGCAMCWYSNEKLIKILGPVIARRVYDLVWYTVENAREYCLEDASTKDVVSYIEDMTVFPSEQEA